jgi:hypothetical protein
MTKRTRSALILIGGLLALALVGVASMRSTDRLGLDSAGEALLTLIPTESPLPEAVRREGSIDVVRLAQEDADFRHWLVGVVASDDVPIQVRKEAVQAFWQVQGDEATRDLAQALLPWMQKALGPSPGQRLRGIVYSEVFYNMLFKTDLPAEEILRLMNSSNQHWRSGSEAFLRYKPPAWNTKSPDDDRKRTARFEEVLALARGRDEARFMELLRAAAPLPQGVEPTLSDLPRLADGIPAFRRWLAGVVASPGEDHWVRAMAFKALLDMGSDKAVVELVADLHGWLRNLDAEPTPEGREEQEQIRRLMLDRLLLTDLPIREVLEHARHSLPFWDTHALSLAAGRPQRLAPWKEEEQARLEERAVALAKAQGGDLLAEVNEWRTSLKQSKEARAPAGGQAAEGTSEPQ